LFRLRGNPICENANIANIIQFCGFEAGGDRTTERSMNSTMTCPVQACPVDNFFEYVPASPLPCFCASPLRIGYRLKSPSFSYFDPYAFPFELHVTSALKLNPYQLSIDSYFWEEGPRLRMHLKIFPPANNVHSNTFNVSEVGRIRGAFTSWHFPGDDLFGPYELLNFTLVGPYAASMCSKFLLPFRLKLTLLILQKMMPIRLCALYVCQTSVFALFVLQELVFEITETS
jgi:hypothetical protein